VYRLLARIYKYTPEQIADMTPYQQMSLLEDDEEQPDSGPLSFDTPEDFLAWKVEHERRRDDPNHGRKEGP
jgi:hypothetical protein